MNANELADKLSDKTIRDYHLYEYLPEIVAMLRQQQAEIEALKKAQMTPYAYAVVQGKDGRENVSLQFDHPEMCGQTYIQAIPLFNHQTEKENQ